MLLLRSRGAGRPSGSTASRRDGCGTAVTGMATARGIPCQREISMAKLLAGQVGMRVIDDCLQMHGGMGYVEEGPIARAWRDARLLQIGGGANEIMKEIITKAIGLGS